MARPRAKKKKVSSDTHTRSVFLYGQPNVEKRRILEKLQEDYTDAVNSYISILYDRKKTPLSPAHRTDHPQCGRYLYKKPSWE